MSPRTRLAAVVVFLAVAAGAWIVLSQRPWSRSPGVEPVQGRAEGRDSPVAVAPLNDEQRSEQLSAATFMNASEVEPLAVERLGGFLPQRLAGLAQSTAGGSRVSETGFPITTVTATYSGGNGRMLELSISDLAGPKGIAAYAGWALVGEHSSSSEDGFEKAYSVGSRRYYQQWGQRAARGEQAVLLANRFAVSIRGSVDTAGALSTALESVDLAGIEQLR